jgi:hypothetical protein
VTVFDLDLVILGGHPRSNRQQRVYVLIAKKANIMKMTTSSVAGLVTVHEHPVSFQVAGTISEVLNQPYAASESSQIIDQVPDVLIRCDFAKRRHTA